MFPCFDEPNLKAQFTISAIVDASFVCASNMPVDYTRDLGDSRKLVVFHKSLLMSTYVCLFPRPGALCY